MGEKASSHTSLFTVRIWKEQLASGQFEWRGRVQYVLSGEVGYFRGWRNLVELFQAMLPIEEVEEDNMDG